MLLVGGGVGTAPMLYYGRVLREAGHTPVFLLGGRSERDILTRERFAEIGMLCCTTEDGSTGEKGFVTQHSVWNTEQFDLVAACGPVPMMKAVAALSRQKGYACRVSLENMMACGIGLASAAWRKPPAAMFVSAPKDRCLTSTNSLGNNPPPFVACTRSAHQAVHRCAERWLQLLLATTLLRCFPAWGNVNSAAPYFRDNSRCAQPTFKGFNPTL